MVLVGVGHEVLAGDLVLHLGARRGIVLERRVEQQRRHRVDPEPVHAPVAPEPHDLAELVLHRLVAQVQAGLLRGEVVEVVLPPQVIPGPGRRPELRQPVVGLRAVGLRIGPDVVVGVARIAGDGALEPRRLDRGVVEHLVDDDPEAQVVRPRHQPVELLERAQQRVDLHVVGDVVAAVGPGRGVERRNPDRVHPELRGVVQPVDDAREVAHAVACRVAEGARIDLVEDGGLRPGAVGQAGSPGVWMQQGAPGAGRASSWGMDPRIRPRRPCRRWGAASGRCSSCRPTRRRTGRPSPLPTAGPRGPSACRNRSPRLPRRAWCRG